MKDRKAGLSQPGRRHFHRLGVGLALSPLILRAQPAAPESPHKAVYMHQGADRDAKLAAEARKEGQLVLYTSLNLKDSVPITEAFEKKTGVKVQLWRASSEKVLQRAVTEARAGRFACDVLETNGPEMEAMYREKLLDPFHSPHFNDLPPAAFPKHRHYVADRFNFFTIGYNTNLVKPE
jgi:iron(III) transport system substrate-binding protein